MDGRGGGVAWTASYPDARVTLPSGEFPRRYGGLRWAPVWGVCHRSGAVLRIQNGTPKRPFAVRSARASVLRHAPLRAHDTARHRALLRLAMSASRMACRRVDCGCIRPPWLLDLVALSPLRPQTRALRLPGANRLRSAVNAGRRKSYPEARMYGPSQSRTQVPCPTPLRQPRSASHGQDRIRA